MARLGIDFGTTNTVVVIEDRGVFSVIGHEIHTAAGTIVQELFPSTILIDGESDRKWFGLEADRQFAQTGLSDGDVYIPSLKRHLYQYSEGKNLVPGGVQDKRAWDMAELLTDFLHALSDSIRRSRFVKEDDPLETVITWPANANGAQRHVTRRAYQEAGFQVVEALNEPTASAIELADWLTGGNQAKRPNEPSAVAVFDLGGGTFDASVVYIEGQDFHVLAAGGIEQLGGDDFDRALLDLFLEKLKRPVGELSPLTRQALLKHARFQKETISVGTIKSLFLNPEDFALAGPMVSIPVDKYYKRVRPTLAAAVSKLGEVIKSAILKQPAIQARQALTIYLVGGSSKLPLVAEMVKNAFGDTRVVLSDKPFRSVAMGAAICATDRSTYRDVFTRHFGVIRLRDHGYRERFDTIFPAGTPLPRKGEPPLEKVAWYHPAHNVGKLRFLECSSLSGDGMPAGDLRAWSDILFPYDPSFPLSARVSRDDIVSTDRFGDQPVCEIYRCDGHGVITVELRRSSCNDSRYCEIYRD